MAGDAVRAYVEAVAGRLAADGCEVNTVDWAGVPAVVGYRRDFRVRWMATTLHLFTIVLPVPSVLPEAVERFTGDALDYAVGRKGQLRGIQSGIGILPAMVSMSVDPAASAWAGERQRMRFAAMARPVVVDLGRGEVAAYRGTPGLGAVYSGHFRRRLDLYFPRPDTLPDRAR